MSRDEAHLIHHLIAVFQRWMPDPETRVLRPGLCIQVVSLQVEAVGYILGYEQDLYPVALIHANDGRIVRVLLAGDRKGAILRSGPVKINGKKTRRASQQQEQQYQPSLRNTNSFHRASFASPPNTKS